MLLSHLPARFPQSVLPAFSGLHLDIGLCSQQMLVIQRLHPLVFRRMCGLNNAEVQENSIEGHS